MGGTGWTEACQSPVLTCSRSAVSGLVPNVAEKLEDCSCGDFSTSFFLFSSQGIVYALWVTPQMAIPVVFPPFFLQSPNSCIPVLCSWVVFLIVWQLSELDRIVGANKHGLSCMNGISHKIEACVSVVKTFATACPLCEFILVGCEVQRMWCEVQVIYPRKEKKRPEACLWLHIHFSQFAKFLHVSWIPLPAWAFVGQLVECLDHKIYSIQGSSGVVQRNRLNTHTHTVQRDCICIRWPADQHILCGQIDMFNWSCKCHNELGVLRAD